MDAKAAKARPGVETALKFNQRFRRAQWLELKPVPEDHVGKPFLIGEGVVVMLPDLLYRKSFGEGQIEDGAGAVLPEIIGLLLFAIDSAFHLPDALGMSP